MEEKVYKTVKTKRLLITQHRKPATKFEKKILAYLGNFVHEDTDSVSVVYSNLKEKMNALSKEQFIYGEIPTRIEKQEDIGIERFQLIREHKKQDSHNLVEGVVDDLFMTVEVDPEVLRCKLNYKKSYTYL